MYVCMCKQMQANMDSLMTVQILREQAGRAREQQVKFADVHVSWV